jgi:hypothetical protein
MLGSYYAYIFILCIWNILSRFYGSDYRRVLDWQLDLLSTLTTCVYTLQFTVTHTLIFLVLVRFHLLSLLNVVASSGAVFLGSGPLGWSSHNDLSLTQLTV